MLLFRIFEQSRDLIGFLSKFDPLIEQWAGGVVDATRTQKNRPHDAEVSDVLRLDDRILLRRMSRDLAAPRSQDFLR
jgi:hypothetical protein